MGFAACSCIYGCRYHYRCRVGSRSTMGFVFGTSDATKHSIGDSCSYYCLWFFDGPGLYGGKHSSKFPKRRKLNFVFQAASRVTFAYARDDCFPASNWIKKVNKHTYTPVNAVWFNTTIGILLLLLIFGGPVAIGAIFSVGAIAAMASPSLDFVSSRLLIRVGGVHNSHFHPSVFCWEPIQGRSMAFGKIQQAHWRDGLCFHSHHDAHALLSICSW